MSSATTIVGSSSSTTPPCSTTLPPTSASLAVLGVFTADYSKNHAHRREARRTWLASVSSSPLIDARFVVRGRGLSKESSLHKEAKAHGDLVFLTAADASLPRESGPLATLIAWFECATQSWPHVRLIGKADDDVMLQLPNIAAHLRGSLTALNRQFNRCCGAGRPQMLWGLMESYHWDAVTHRPDGFDHGFGYTRFKNCSAHNEVLKKTRPLGPFNFAKGACLFLSRTLASQLLTTQAVRDEFDAAIAATADKSAQMQTSLNRLENPEALPWEDVLLGWALATAIKVSPQDAALPSPSPNFSPAPLALVDIGRHVYAEEWYSHKHGLGLAPSTLILHNGGKRPSRIGRAHRWARRHHCAPKAVQLDCEARTHTSCSGARWRRCSASVAPYKLASCSTTIETNLSARALGGVSAQCLDAARTSDRVAAALRGGGAAVAVDRRGRRQHRPVVGASSGHCGDTEFGDFDCSSDESGAWPISKLRNRSLAACVAQCACCEACRYVSFAPSRNDCSWYRSCDLSRLEGVGERGTVSVAV